MDSAEFCERFGWSSEKFRKVAQRARARLRALIATMRTACGSARSPPLSREARLPAVSRSATWRAAQFVRRRARGPRTPWTPRAASASKRLSAAAWPQIHAATSARFRRSSITLKSGPLSALLWRAGRLARARDP
jgi:hypothetical protein